MNDELKDNKPPMVGRNILAIRKKLSFTLNVLSERSGVSRAMLSQIESEKVNPTVATVWKIAQGLGVEIQEVLKDSGSSHRKFAVNRKQQVISIDTDADHVHIRVLSPISMVEELEMYWLTINPSGVLESEPHIHDTEEFLTVIEGDIEVTAGDNSTVLGTEDFIRYHSDLKHSIRNLGDKDAIVHMVVKFNKKYL
ncbi:MAG: helix-turn-helix transcriptional regulator [Spirochaetales bacterium]|nr:helix-turn-helix transcriptional regulator [Spirochaetales bacterium]